MKRNAERDLPVWRSLLSVPVNVDKYVDSAGARGADCIMLDLEDSIPEHEKHHARSLLPRAVERVAGGGADVCVRVNCPIEHAVRDIEQAVCPRVDAIALPKIDSASHLRILDDLVSRLEQARAMTVGTTRFFVMVETADAYNRLYEIAHAVERTVAMLLGSEDLAAECDFSPTPETLLHYKQEMIVVAKSAGLMPLGFVDSVAGIGDWDEFRRMVQRSRRFGYMGAVCIHPKQVAIANAEFRPSPDEVEDARKIVALDEAAARSGSGAFALDGKMIDVPVVRRARRLLSRHEKIVAREQRARAYK
ncbi:MAG: CoA ester lyase [Burkholderiales bacterium]|nr:CoA ester lyase [Burkholderiales bacterium]